MMMNSMLNSKSNDCIKIIEATGKKKVASFHLNEIDIKVYRMVYAYLFHYYDFENYHPTYSLSKGLLITGNIGVGKSYMMQIFQEIARKISSYKIVKQSTLLVNSLK
ncbi:hypothetical protein [Carboxylicivirga caseinilyticus]|uniref:hypothetical protein n=1 Tax=Carboxylicivirga caseinilyticus TaxID=3417572 RepID=UPI003D32CB8C|nr:hypothetical protein [Marinilabiliaceae bacterium A049]